MNAIKHNPVLAFLLDAADAARYVWTRYLEQLVQISWAKLLLLSLLALIISSVLFLHGLVTLLVFASLILKAVMPKRPPHSSTEGGEADGEK